MVMACPCAPHPGRNRLVTLIKPRGPFLLSIEQDMFGTDCVFNVLRDSPTAVFLTTRKKHSRAM